MQKVIIEFIGVFILVLTFGLATRSEMDPSAVALATGAMLAALTYAGAHISRAHYNPAVTLAMRLRDRCDPKESGLYIAAQGIAAIAAAIVACLLQPVSDSWVTGSSPFWKTSILELIFTLGLVFVFLQVTINRRQQNNHFHGMAVGFTFFAAYTVAGALLNPALTVSAAILGVVSWSAAWWMVIVQFAGAFIAVKLYDQADKEPPHVRPPRKPFQKSRPPQDLQSPRPDHRGNAPQNRPPQQGDGGGGNNRRRRRRRRGGRPGGGPGGQGGQGGGQPSSS